MLIPSKYDSQSDFSQQTKFTKKSKCTYTLLKKLCVQISAIFYTNSHTNTSISNLISLIMFNDCAAHLKFFRIIMYILLIK